MMRTEMASAERSILREGIVAGLIGAAVVAVWFLVFDIIRGQPFLTPGLLGAAVFQGVTDPKRADAMLTDQIGAMFEEQLETLLPSPVPEKKAAPPPAPDKDKSAAPLLPIDKETKLSPVQSTFGSRKGTLFLVDPKSHQVA